MRGSDGRVRKSRERFNEPGQAHELTFSCHRRLPMLSKDRTRMWFIEALDCARRRWALHLWAYVIMPEHAHVLVFPAGDEYDVALILKGIKQSVARRATNYLRKASPAWLDNLKVVWPGGRVEYRFWEQGGGYDRNVRLVETAWNSAKYIHNTPVRRGLVASATDWEWSSARWYAGDTNVRLVMDGTPGWGQGGVS